MSLATAMAKVKARTLKRRADSFLEDVFRALFEEIDAEKIRREVRRLNVSHANHDLGAISLSLGVAIFPDDTSEGTTIVKAADLALYRAKRDGRNRVVMFTEKAAQIRAPVAEVHDPAPTC